MLQKASSSNQTPVSGNFGRLTSQETTKTSSEMINQLALVNDINQAPKSLLLSHLEAFEKKIVPFSSSLKKLLETTPKSLWKTVKVNLIVSFTSHQKMNLPIVSNYDPIYMDNLPIATFDVTLDSIDDVKSLPGVKGVFLDEHVPFKEEDWNPFDIATYPSENVIGARYLQGLGINGSGVTIAILDTGIDKTHPDLDDIDNIDSTDDPKVILEASFVDFDRDGLNDTSPMDDHFHGTHVAGIAAGSGYLNGVAPGATLMNGKVLDKTIGGYTSWIVKGIDWAISNGADIISMSLGGLPGDSDPLFEEAINTAWENGVIVVASAGNSGPEPSSISSPGMESRALSVGASDIYNNVTFFSSRGPSPNGIVDPDIVAPGRGILSLEPGGLYTIASGTSMSAPAVAGVVALLLSLNRSADLGANIDDIRNSILSTTSDMGVHVFTQGAGLVNASAAAAALHELSVFAYPSFGKFSPLVLSPGESFSYQLDVFLNQSYNTLSVSSSLEPYANVSYIDLNTEGWIRARVNVTMPNSAMNGVIMVKNGSEIYYNATLYLQPDIESDDADSGTDAGETFFGAISLAIGIPIEGEVHKWDRDLYSFPVVKDQVYSVDLFNLTGDLNLFITDENGTFLNQSLRKGYLPERAIFKAQSSGSYFIRIEDKTPGRYSLLIQKAKESLLFYQPAYLTGNIESNPFDFDSDDLYDELRLSIEVNVLEAGMFDFWYSIAQNRTDYAFGRYVFLWDWLNITLREGIHHLNISVPGGILESSGYNGSYVINDLAFGKGNFSLVLSYDFEVYTTSVYNCTSFDPLDNSLNSYSIEKEDLNGNGTPEKLKVNFEFEFLTTGVYGVGVPIYNENQNELLAYEIETFSVSQVGLTSVSIEFIVQQFKDTSDIAVFGVVGSWYRYYIPIFTEITKEEISNFDSVVDFELMDYAIDSDRNGKDDAIRLEFNITSKVNTEIVVFTGHPYSYPNETMVLVNSSEKSIELDQGFNSFWIDFDARILNVHDLSGPYFFPSMGITFEKYEFTLYFPYVTSNYPASDFESSEVWFSSFFSSVKYENTTDSGIEVNWEVTSKSQIDVFFEFEVRDYEPIKGKFSKIINFTKQVGVGSTNFNFKIGAEALFNSSYIGSLELYTASIFLPGHQNGLKHRYQENELSIIDFVFHAAILPSVNYEDYAIYVDAYFIKSPQIKLDDSGLSTNVSIGINKVGTYDLGIDLYSKNDYSTQNVKNTTRLKITEIGNYSHIFHFSLKTIRRIGFDESFFGNITILNLESSYKSELTIPHMLINQSSLKYNLPLQVLSVTSDRALDEDQDGKFDKIEIKLLINISQENDYNFSAKIHAQFDNFHEAHLGSVSLSSMHFLQGLHNISFSIPYYFFLTSYNKAIDLDLLPIVEVFIVPLNSFDPEGMFVVSTKPLFIEKEYDLRDFLITQPLSIGYVRITQVYSDGIPEKLEVNVIISIKKILPYSLEVSLDLYWDISSVSVKQISSHNPTNTGNIYYKFPFMLSEIFSNLPYQYSVKASIIVASFDGIQIDDYVMPVKVTFITEPLKIITSSQTTITSTTTPRRTNGIEGVFAILTVIFCIIVIKKKKEK